jgi:hypothetical protein
MRQDINIDGIYEAVTKAQNRTVPADGCIHSSVRMYDACMRAFDRTPAAEAITFNVFLNAPIMGHGTITIHRDGQMEVHREEQVE